MKPPPAIDAAMWELAESTDQAALDAFVARYPEYQAELTQRIRMVRGLRGLKPNARVTAKARFVPVGDPLPMPTTNRWMVPVAATLVLGSLVFATVSATRWLDTRSQPSPHDGLSTAADPDARPDKPRDIRPKPVVENGPIPKNAQAPEQVPEAPKTPWDNLVTLRTDRSTLVQALNDIAVQAGVSLEFGPNMPDIDIQADYRGQPAMVVLRDLGKNFGFSVLQETQNTGLVIPAVDPRAQPLASSPGTSALARDIPPENDRQP